MKIAVIGAGIIGVSSAYAIKCKYPQHDLVVFAKEFSPNTTSDGAAGLWEPFVLNDTPQHLVLKWSKQTYDYAMQLIQNDPSSGLSGIYTTHGFNLSTDEKTDLPFWSEVPYDFGELSEKDLMRFPPEIKSGYKFTTVFMEGSKFIPWLSRKILDMGGKFIQRTLGAIEELAIEFDIVVNCSGYSAKTLVPDENIFPVRGQVMHVKAPWVKEFMLFDNITENKTTYILPNQDYVVLGGTIYVNDTNTEIDELDKEHISISCQQLLPSLKYAEHLSDWVGLRPGRNEVRLEKENIIVERGKEKKLLKVIHNYGHGGAGITLNRGCALEVAKCVEESLNEISLANSENNVNNASTIFTEYPPLSKL